MLPNWFSQRFENRINWRQFNQNVQISLIRRYVYVETPKVACSTIKKRLFADAVGQLPRPEKLHPALHDSPLVKPYQLSDETMMSILDDAEFYRFTFVREPTERIVSAYLDKIIRDSPIRDRFTTKYLPNQDPTQKIEFDEFLDILLTIDDFRSYDKHWRPQSELIFEGAMKYNFIGCFARFEEDWDIVSNEIRLPENHKRATVLWHATSASKNSNELVTPESREKIETIYKRDMELYQQVLCDSNLRNN